MFRKLAIGPGIQPSTELTGIQSSNDISISGEESVPGDVVQAADPQTMNPPVPPTQTPQGFGRLSVKQACKAIEDRARRIVVRGF
jgi:hypothetical protein